MAKKSLLLVDADSKSLRMLEVSLRKSGFSVTTAVHAKDARDKLNHAAPDLIITDTKLPGDESGFDFVSGLKGKNETAGIPIIFLSSENKLEQKVAGLELGVEDYLTKPIYIKEVLTRVRVLLDKREKQTLERRERSSSFAGLLGDMGLVDLMQTVEIGRKTGRLFIETKQAKGQVSFREGKVTDARCGRLSGERAFYRMLVWNEGTFSMEFGPHDDADVIELSTQGLLMEGMRRVDEWGRLIEQLPPLDHRFEIDYAELVERLAEVPDEINALLRRFDGRRTLLEVVDETDFGDLEALEIASKLFFEGLIFDVTDREPVGETGAKVENWLQEPGATLGEDDGDELLVPNDTVPPTAVETPNDSPILAPPTPPVVGRPPAPEIAARATPPPPPDPQPADLAPVLGTTPRTAPPAPEAAPVAASDLPPTPLMDLLDDAELVADALPTIPARPTRPTTLEPAAAASAQASSARPLPSPGDDALEARSVAPRSAVGARAWSTLNNVPVDDHEEPEGWEDIVAPDDEPTPRGMPMVVGGGVDESAPTVVEPASPIATATPSSAPRVALADELGLSEDELAMALSSESNAPPTVVDLAERSGPADGGGAAGVPSLAERIAAQLDATPEESLGENGNTLAVAAAGADAPDKLPPAPAPLTSTPSSAPNVATADNETLPALDAEAGDRDSIHTRRTQLDIEPLPPIDRFGFSPPVAAGLFAAAFLVVFVIVKLATGGDGEAPNPQDDAGIHVAVPTLPRSSPPAEPPAPPPTEAPPAPPEPPPPEPAPTPTPPLAPLPVPPPAVEVPSPPQTPPPTVNDDAAQYAKHLRAAESLAKRGDYGKSVRAYKAALAVDKDAVAAHLGLGNAYYELDSLDAAIFHLERARALAPKDATVYVHLGAAYQSAGRTPDAVTAYRRYLELDPSGPFSRDVRGILKGLGG